jgi:hypothetical protein
MKLNTVNVDCLKLGEPGKKILFFCNHNSANVQRKYVHHVVSVLTDVPDVKLGHLLKAAIICRALSFIG